MEGSRESLTGVWDGAYSYPHPYAILPPTPFRATMFETAGALGGEIQEVAEQGSFDLVLVPIGGSIAMLGWAILLFARPR